MSRRRPTRRARGEWSERITPAVVMLPAGLVWQLLDQTGGMAVLDGRVFFLLSLVVGAIGAIGAGALATIADSRRLVSGALACEALLLVALVVLPEPGNRAFLSIAEAALRTGTCVLLLLAPAADRPGDGELALLERGRWAGGGLLLGVLVAELAQPATHGFMLAGCGAALFLASLILVWANASHPSQRRMADGLSHERA